MNTKLVVALFVGAISAKQLPNINMLTVQTSDEGVEHISAQEHRVENAWDNARRTRQAHNAAQAGEAWAHSNETQEFFEVVQRASESDEAHRLDSHLRTIKYGIKQIPNGAHIDNEVLEGRLHAIEQELDHIEHETSFPQEAGQAW